MAASPTPDPRLGGAVLCGGASRRMGTDKATLSVDGSALVRRSADALTAAGVDPVVAVGGALADLRQLGLDAVADGWPGEGPLGGIVTALGGADRWWPDADAVAVLACDLLAPSQDVIGALAAEVRAGADLAVPVVDGRDQWLHAVWSTGATEVLRSRFEAGIRAPRRAVEALRVVRLAVDDTGVARDADTPADLP